MTQFAYTAIPVQGSGAGKVTGTRQAPDERSLRDELRATGLIVIEARPVHFADMVRTSFGQKRLRRSDGAWFFQTLCVLLQGNVPIEPALSTMLDLAPNPRLHRACADVREKLRGGDPLAQAVESAPGLAHPRHIALLQAGHESGQLAHVVGLINASIGNAARLRRMVVGRMIYPIILFVVALLAVWGLSTFVIPRFAEQLEAMGGTLPLPTRITLGASHILVWVIPPTLLLGALAVVFHRAWVTPAMRSMLSRFVQRVPVMGQLVWHAQAAVICDMLATMLEGGGELLDGLAQASAAVTSPEIARRLGAARTEVREGVDLGQALADHQVLPPLVTAMVRVGVETGELKDGLRRAGDTCMERQDHITGRLMTLLEPAVIVLMAGCVFWVVFSLISGMLAMNDIQGL